MGAADRDIQCLATPKLAAGAPGALETLTGVPYSNQRGRSRPRLSHEENLMQPETPMMAQRTGTTSLALAQNRVLRNTYLLLAISLVPTILGAWIGVQLNFNLISAAHPALGFIAFLAIAFGFFYGIEKTKNSSMGVVLLLGFTFFMGLMLSRMLAMVLGLGNG